MTISLIRNFILTISVFLIFMVLPVLIMLLTGTTAYAAPNNRPLSTLEELLQWHETPPIWGDAPVLGNDILIDRSVTLSQTSVRKDLGAIEHSLRVTDGCTLTIDNTNLAIMTPKGPAILVESGGQLILKNGSVYSAAGAHAIIIEQGGSFEQSESFQIDGGIIVDENDEAEPPQVPDNNPALYDIVSTTGFDYTLTCMTGKPPAASDYPATEWVNYAAEGNKFERKELPVTWELGNVDFGTAGTYKVSGVFLEEVLAANHLNNPKNITATLQLTILNPAPIDTLTGNILSIGSKGNCLLRLQMPVLLPEVTALYLYRSADGLHWEKVFQEAYIDGNVPITYDDFLPYGIAVGSKFYVNYRYPTDYQPIWMKVEIVGSACAGMSNAIQIKMPPSAKPGEGVSTGENGDDGSSGGNRGGGGGQNESVRDLPDDGTQDAGQNQGGGGTTAQTPETGEYVSGVLPSGSKRSAPTASTSSADKCDSLSNAVQEKEQGFATSGSSLSIGGAQGAEQQIAAKSAAKSAAESGGSFPVKVSRGVFQAFSATALTTLILLYARKQYKRKRK